MQKVLIDYYYARHRLTLARKESLEARKAFSRQPYTRKASSILVQFHYSTIDTIGLRLAWRLVSGIYIDTRLQPSPDPLLDSYAD